MQLNWQNVTSTATARRWLSVWCLQQNWPVLLGGLMMQQWNGIRVSSKVSAYRLHSTVTDGRRCWTVSVVTRKTVVSNCALFCLNPKDHPSFTMCRMSPYCLRLTKKLQTRQRHSFAWSTLDQGQVM